MKKITLFTVLLTINTVFSQIEKIEPPFWWSNMKNPELQLLVYGKNISHYTISVSKEARITSVIKTENPNYLFITINTKKVKPGYIKLSFSENTRIIQEISYEFKKRRKNAALRKGFSSEDAIYLLMPDRFANGNPENDNTNNTYEKVNRQNPDGRHGGDIQGIINHLDYIKDLGFTAIWSTPLLEDNEPQYSYHTYAQSNLYKIDPRYGTNEDYKQLATELHNRNMKLIMDYVTNHWGSQHWIIKDLPTKDWIHYWKNGEKGFRRSNYRMTTQFDPNASINDTNACTNGWFDTTMPDINQTNPLVLKYITQNAIWWIEYADLDGLRVDTYSYNNKEAIAKWTKAITEEYPYINIVGEVWMHNQSQIAYWQKDSKIGLIQNYNSYLPSVMDFTLHDAITTVFNEDKATWFDGLIKVYENFANDFLYPNINNIMIFAGNHDTNRINEIYHNDINKYKLAITLIATARGIPQFYYGDEIGMTGNKDKNGDGDIRKDFPGGWSSDANNAFTYSGRTKSQNEYFSFTKKIFNWRKLKKVIHTGKTMQFIPQNNVYVYFRYNDFEKVMIVLNNSLQKQELDLKRFNEIIKNSKTGKEIISGKTVSLQNKLQINAKTPMIVEFQ